MEESVLQRLEYVCEYRGVEFIFTQDLAKIEQFMQLYDDLCKNDPRLIGFRDFCDDDINNYIGQGHSMQLLMKDGRCIGGGRFTHPPKGPNFLLPLEKDIADQTDDTKYLLKNLLPELDIGNDYLEVSRLLLAPEYRGDTTFSGTMFVNFCVRWIETPSRYMFVLADRVRSRMYCQLMRKFTQLDGHLFKSLPTFNHIDSEGVNLQITAWDKYNRLKDIYAPKGAPK